MVNLQVWILFCSRRLAHQSHTIRDPVPAVVGRPSDLLVQDLPIGHADNEAVHGNSLQSQVDMVSVLAVQVFMLLLFILMAYLLLWHATGDKEVVFIFGLSVCAVGVCLAWWCGQPNAPNVWPSCPMPFASPKQTLKEMRCKIFPFRIPTGVSIPASAFPSGEEYVGRCAPCYVLLVVRNFVNTSGGTTLRKHLDMFPDSIFHNSQCEHFQVKVLEQYVPQVTSKILEIGARKGKKDVQVDVVSRHFDSPRD